jgi:transcriptional regulator with XRE-family HTH domain
MPTSASHFQLSSPAGEDRVSPSVLSYFEGRNRYKVFDLVWDEFRASGLTQAALARRLGMSPPQLNRLLKSPGNWTLDTVSNLLFAIRGGEPAYHVNYPLEQPARNDNQPQWLEKEPEKKNGNTATVFNLNVSPRTVLVSRST